MEFLTICNTPFQVFNIINAITNNIESLSEDNTDILIDMTFKTAKEIGERIVKKRLCRRVYYTKKGENYPQRSKMQCLLDLIINRTYDEYFEFSDKSVMMNHYDAIWVGDDNPLGLMVFKSNPKAKVYWYDDGTSSYSQSPQSYNHKGFYNVFAKAFRLGGYKYRSNILYLNNIDVVQYEGFDLRALPSYCDYNKAVEKLNVVFDYNKLESKLSNYRIVVLTQVLPDSAAYKGIDIKQLFDCNETDLSKVLIRKHPRDPQNYTGCVMDSGKNMWELECLNSINNDHILIACCSTAQLTPKIVGGKEPYIFFLHRLLLGEGSTVRDGFEKMIKDLVEMYSNKSKIYIPDTVEEFKEQYSKLVNGGN